MLKSRFIICSIIVGMGISGSVLAGKETSLCQPDETVIFSCQLAVPEVADMPVKKGSMISVCAEKQAVRDNPAIYYIQGEKNKVDLRYPEKNSQHNSSIQLIESFSPANKENKDKSLYFMINNVAYSVYDYIFGSKGMTGLIIDDKNIACDPTYEKVSTLQQLHPTCLLPNAECLTNPMISIPDEEIIHSLLPTKSKLLFTQLLPMEQSVKPMALVIYETISEEEKITQRTLLILHYTDDNQWQILSHNEAQIVLCSTCGGMGMDPFDRVDIGKNQFTIVLQYKNSWDSRTFSYNSEKHEWYLSSAILATKDELPEKYKKLEKGAHYPEHLHYITLAQFNDDEFNKLSYLK